MCYLCHWQDDGQSDVDADKVYGGPNGRYSLSEARVNFKKYLVKYSPDNDTRIVPTDLPEEVAIKKLLINLFNESKLINDKYEKEKIWLEISRAEDRLHTAVAQKINPFVKK
ncbi:MAG: CPCC family cysteine-rich protein [Proteocatella sp.]